MLYNLVDSNTDSLRESVRLCHQLCELINTPRSLAVSLMIQYGCW
jgi:hypothetical protein